MEKGFNDDELADIMSEIESLEQEFADDSKDVAALATESTDKEDSHDAKMSAARIQEEIAQDEGMQEVLEELSDVPINNVVPMSKTTNSVVTKTKSSGGRATTNSSNTTCMSFKVEGQMNIQLNFEIGGETIGLNVSDEAGLVIQMGSGVTFSVPVTNTVARKKAA